MKELFKTRWEYTMSTEQIYKKFLCQKVVLDLLRVYIDITEETLQLLHSRQLITDDELHLIQVFRV